VVRVLLAAKADVNAKMSNGATALISASENGHQEVVRVLLAAKADVNAKMSNGATALVYAANNGHLEVVQALLATQADVNAKMSNGGTALMAASEHGHLEVVRGLLAAQADANAKMGNGVTALILASQNGQAGVVWTLLDAKADVNAKRDDGQTALMVASEHGYAEVVRELLAAQADVNAKMGNGVTALILASEQGHKEVVRALLDAKADVNAKTNNGETALELASRLVHVEVVELLKSATAASAASLETQASHEAEAKTPPLTVAASAPGHSTTAQTTLSSTARQAIQEAQKRLRVLGYETGSADGVMGSETILALKKFQSDRGFSVTGVLDRKTLDALNVTSVSTNKLPQAPDGNHKPSPPVQKAQPEEYHVVDAAKAGFKLVLQMSSFTRDSMGRIVDGDIMGAKIDDEPSPVIQGNEYPIELVSNEMTDGKIHTTRFGDFLTSSNGEFMMTDSQVKQVQNFLHGKKKDAKH
jgi:ankyrin repeat protein